MHHMVKCVRATSGILRSVPGQTVPLLLSPGDAYLPVWGEICRCLSDKARAPRQGRPLLNPEQVFLHNNWDRAQWDTEREEAAVQRLRQQEEEAVPPSDRRQLEEGVKQAWEEFYSQHGSSFFKQRRWLCREFPELLQSTPSTAAHCQTKAAAAESSATPHLHVPNSSAVETSNDGCDVAGQSATCRILEVGCGTGSAFFPILQENKNPGLYLYGCDYSAKAIEILKSNAAYDASRCQVFHWDITDPSVPCPLPDSFLDIIQLVFVLSAVNPAHVKLAVQQLASLLKPNGLILFRDYGWADLAQLRFKKGHCLDTNYYVRGDGTTAYFFKQDEVSQLFQEAGLVEEMLWEDRRVQVNRKQRLTMYRVWLQGKFRKPA